MKCRCKGPIRRVNGQWICTACGGYVLIIKLDPYRAALLRQCEQSGLHLGKRAEEYLEAYDDLTSPHAAGEGGE